MSLDSPKNAERISKEAQFQDARMRHALQGEREFRDKFYFINRQAYSHYDEMLSGLQGQRVVVVGCSDCGVTPLARHGVHVEGIDISAASIKKLSDAIVQEGLSDYASARVMDAERLEYASRSIDVITCSGVLHHLHTEAALQSWARALKPTGKVVMFEPLALHPLVAIFRLLTPGMRTEDEHPLREHDFALMRRYFTNIERHDYGLLTPIAAALAVVPGLSWLARLLLPIFETADEAILRLVPFLRRFCWLTVVRLGAPRG